MNISISLIESLLKLKFKKVIIFRINNINKNILFLIGYKLT